MVTNLEAAVLKRDPLTLIRTTLQKYRSSKSFSAEFFQEVIWRRGLYSENSTGRFWYKSPNFFRWEYLEPKPVLIVSDGKKVWTYLKEERQLVVYSLESVRSQPLALLLFKEEDPLKDWELLHHEFSREFLTATFVPKKDSLKAQLQKVRFRIDLKEFLLKELSFEDFLGNETRITFKNWKFDIKISVNLFYIRVPEGVEVIKGE